MTVVEHAVVRIDSHLDRIAGEMAAMRSGLERQIDRLSASIDSLRNSVEVGLREQRIWTWSAFRWQLGITLAIGAGLFGMIAHGLKWF